MALRRFLHPRSRERARGASEIDAMIADGDLDRAESWLRARVRAIPDSLGYRVKLADLLARKRERGLAALEYMGVAEAHAKREGYGPAIRMAGKAVELSPGNVEMTTRLVELERLRRAHAKRAVIFDALEHGERPPGSDRKLTSSRLLELWPEVYASDLVQELAAGG